MKSTILGLISVVLLGVCGGASANITYTVNLSGNGETVTGTITTDGATGSLIASDFISWSLNFSGTFDGIDDGPPDAPLCELAGCGIHADTANLTFTGTGLDIGLTLEQFPPFSSLNFNPGGVTITDPTNPFNAVPLILTAPYVVGQSGQSSAPEPPTAILLSLALAGLGFSRRQRKQ